ncbi:MAG: MFS transporter [Planctomycetia bacterium]|nr:MFS transporter [Planctomycetia bacterium]
MRSPAQSPTHVRYQVMAFLLAVSFLTYFDRVCIVRVQGEIQRELFVTDEQMGYILGAFWLAYSVFEIPAGWLGDRFGARLTLTRVVFFWSLFTVLTGFATGFISLLVIRFLFGVGEAGAFPNMARVQSNWLPKEARGRAGGWLWLAARWGGAFSPFLFAAIIRWIDTAAVRSWLDAVPGLQGVSSWRIGFGVAGLIGFIWCIWFYFWFRDTPEQKSSVNAAELQLIRTGREKDVAHHVPFRELWRDLLANRSLLAIIGFYLFGSFGWSFFVSWMPRYLKDVHQFPFDLSESVWKQPLLYGGISCLLGGTLSDWLVRRTGRKWLGRAIFPLCGLTTAAIAIFCVPYVDNPEDAVILMCVAGAAFDFGQGATWASIVDIGGLYAGTAAGFINMFGNMGNAIQPRIGAWIFGTFGWNPLFVVYACAFLAAASMWFLIDPSQTFHRRGEKAKS